MPVHRDVRYRREALRPNELGGGRPGSRLMDSLHNESYIVVGDGLWIDHDPQLPLRGTIPTVRLKLVAIGRSRIDTSRRRDCVPRDW